MSTFVPPEGLGAGDWGLEVEHAHAPSARELRFQKGFGRRRNVLRNVGSCVHPQPPAASPQPFLVC